MTPPAIGHQHPEQATRCLCTGDPAPAPGPYHHGPAPPGLLAAVRALRTWRARRPRLGTYAPVSTLELSVHTPSQALVPAIDCHAHLGRWLTGGPSWMEPDVHALVATMDCCNIEAAINLDGRWGSELEANLDRYDHAWPGRFFTFCHLDWRQLDLPRGPDRLIAGLERAAAAGARGVKVWKDLGRQVKVHGRRVRIGDPILNDVWGAAGELGLPVLVHVADPAAFFHPVDRHNERLEELLRHPGSSRAKDGTAELARLIDSFESAVGANPETTFIAAHGCYVENLQRVARMLGTYPNLYIDIGHCVHELGRQPRAASALILAHSERVLFGSDAFPLSPGAYRRYFRLLETDDEAFAYSEDEPPRFGRWTISGLCLPAPVLRLLYRENAVRLLYRPSATAQAPTADARSAPPR